MKGESLLERMRVNKSGWKLKDIDRLYKDFGFTRKEGRRHTLYVHEDYPELRATVTRSKSPLPQGYITHAVRCIEELKLRKREL